MWNFCICDKGGISLYKDGGIILNLLPEDDIEFNIKKSIKYISELITLNIEYSTNEENIEFNIIACNAIIELNNLWKDIKR